MLPATAPSATYVGDELTLFAHATNWKRYFRDRIRAELRGAVLEVGAGLGGTTRILCDGLQRSWTALEPDPVLAEALRGEGARHPFAVPVTVVTGTLGALSANATFDTVLYIDVLEHIEDDAAELRRAAAHVSPGGAIVALSPAHQFLYSAFDARIGHFRRYTKRTFAALTPADFVLEKIVYLDAVGVLASAANRLLLRQSEPTLAQVKLWDRAMVRLSQRIDPLLGYRIGKSVLAVWRRPQSE